MGKPLKKRALRNKKAPPKPRSKNRYMRGSKLSEYKFLQILKGFAEDKTTRELASEVRISEKTIRATYRHLRVKLLEAMLTDKNAFGGAGLYLLRSGRLDEKGKRFMQGVAESDLFAEHLKRHLIRIHRPEDLQAHLIEVTVRVFCNISMRGSVTDYPPETRQALENMQDIGNWIRENINQDGFMEKYGHVVERFRKVSADMKLLLEKEELLNIRSKSRAHHYPWNLMYEDFRLALAKI